MQEYQSSKQVSDELDLGKLFSAIWKAKWLIITATSLFVLTSVFYALSLPDIYKSEVTLASAEDSKLKMSGQLGGLAALAGVNLGGIGNGDKSALALEVLSSRDFIGRFIEKNDLYVPVMAAKGWDRTADSLILDSEIYDESRRKWTRKVEPPFMPQPSTLETVEEFRKIFVINQDKSSGIVKLSIEYYSPYLAKKWLDNLVIAINEEMRMKELNEAEKSMTYLNAQILQTNLSDVRSMLYSLIEEQTKTVMLAKVREEYVFKTVDKAVATEKKYKPARALIVMLFTSLGFLISVLIVVLQHLYSKND